MPRSPLQPGLQKACFLTDCRHDWPAAFRVYLSIQQNRAVRWCRARSASLLPSPTHLLELCDQAGALALIGFCGPQRIWCSTHKSENPGDLIDSYLSLRPLEVQPSLGGTNKCLSFDVTHEPVPPLPMPTRSGTYLTPDANETGFQANRILEFPRSGSAVPGAQAAINSRLSTAQQIRRRVRSADGRWCRSWRSTAS